MFASSKVRLSSHSGSKAGLIWCVCDSQELLFLLYCGFCELLWRDFGRMAEGFLVPLAWWAWTRGRVRRTLLLCLFLDDAASVLEEPDAILSKRRQILSSGC
jgi:hypothetical protein